MLVFFEITGQNVLKVSNRPHGSCRTCCPVKRNKDIKFIAFRRARPAAGRIMAMPHRPGNAKKSGISSGLKTVIFIHGFSESAPGPSSLTVKNCNSSFLLICAISNVFINRIKLLPYFMQKYIFFQKRNKNVDCHYKKQWRRKSNQDGVIVLWFISKDVE